MNRKRIIIALLLLPVIIGCSTIKIGLFRGMMKIFGGKVYESRFIALNDPEFINSKEQDYLRDEEEVIGLSYNGVSKAYPLTMSFYHHIFNDNIGGRDVLVTFCPLTHTAMVFDPIVSGTQAHKFTVDGLKESNMIMLDDFTRSHWVQLTGEAIEGIMEGMRLELMFALHTTWGLWRMLHPNTLVLSRETGFDYDYSVFPWQEKYFKYKKTSRFLFNITHRDDRYHPKEMILGVEVDDIFKAYPFTELQGMCVINDSVGQTPIAVFYDSTSQTITAFSRLYNDDVLSFRAEADSNCLKIRDSIYGSTWNIEGRAYEGQCEGEALKYVTSFKAFWCAWIAFYPGTLVYTRE